jgi:hypothetical protein
VFSRDGDPTAIASLRELVERYGLVNVDVEAAPVDDPHLPAATFDRILVDTSWNQHVHLGYAVRLAAALARALARGGTVVLITSKYNPSNLQPTELIEILWKAGLQAESVQTDVLGTNVVVVGRKP